MKNKKMIRNILVVLAAAFIFTGCGSMRLASTLKPSGEKDLRLGSTRFSIISYGIEYDKNNPMTKNWFDKLDQKFIDGRSYPFSRDDQVKGCRDLRRSGRGRGSYG